MNRRSLWHENENKSAIRSETFNVGVNETLLVSQFSLISLGTELNIASGGMPESIGQKMTVPGMDGTFDLPVKYGYSVIGIRNEADGYYHTMQPHQTRSSVSLESLFRVPDDVPPKRACLCSNMQTALTAVWDAGLLPGERILIVGFGMVGSLIARLAGSIPGTEVVICEKSDARLALGRSMGFTMIPAAVQHTDSFDAAFNCTGVSEGLQVALDCVGMEGRVLEVSWHGSRPSSLTLGGSFHIKRKKIISSQVSTIPPLMQPRWDFERRKMAVFQILRDPAYDNHITHVISLQEAADLFDEWRHTPPEGLGYCIDYSL